MKRILLFVLLIGSIPALACSGTITKPTAILSDGVSMETAIAAPTPSPPITPAPTTTPSPEICEVTADALHVRDAPTIEGIVIAWQVLGDHLTILPDPPAGDWVKVQTADAITGWVNSIYCERNMP